MREHLKCPKCNQSNTVEFWDKNTKEEIGLDDQSLYTSAGADRKDHEEVEAYFHCPICNEEVAGIDLVKEG